ncbi:MAG TPA: tetratricopeptide repeat protein [bacterium]|nr:tetratricopeptide repeat protein [bacterium]
MLSLGERIRARRKELRLTQSQLGGTDLTKGFISLIEKDRAKPSIETLILLAKRLQRPIGYFLEESTPLGRRALQTLLSLGWALLKQGDFTQAAETFTQTRTIAQQHDDKNAEAEACCGLGSALAGLRQFDLARQNVARARDLAGEIQEPRQLARISHVLGLIAYYERDLTAAREHFLEAHRRVQADGEPDASLAGALLLNLGNTYQEAGEHQEAARWYREALALLEPTQDLRRIGLVHVQLGIAHRDAGRPDAALAHLARAEHIFELLEDIRLLAQARTSMGIMLLERGDVQDAIEQLRSSLHIKQQLGDDPGRARSLTELARALVATGALADAEEALTEAERLTRRLKDTTEAARITLVRARLTRAQGHPADAVRHYKQAIASFEHLDMRADLASAANELGEFLIDQKRPSDAAPYLARALRELRQPNLTGRVPGSR